MTEHKDEKVEKTLKETGAPKQDRELSDADVEKVAGGIAKDSTGGVIPN